ncbi:MAG TPA: zf-HC2 domain-containing protein [Pseudonocardia sp.]|nr:zf-HC2 domain-containing protein [Pseudonocardia sp.]
MIISDLSNMGCSTCREHLSADLDGEADPAELPAARAHLAECPECTHWFSDAALVNRLIRTAPADPAPGLTDTALAEALSQLPRPRSPRRRLWNRAARLALGVVGVVQAFVGGVGLVLASSGGDPDAAMAGSGAMGHAMMGHAMMGSGVMGADMAHMSHESSAWNLALGVAFLAGAVWTRHLAGTIPVLGSFVVVLTLVSTLDLVSGNVDPARVGSHALVLVGLGLIMLIMATRPTEYQPQPVRAPSPPPWTTRVPGAGAADISPRPASSPTRPDPAARHRAA